MSVKRILAVVVFLVGAFIGASTRTDMWDRFPSWVWILVLIIALAICGAGVELWRSAVTAKKDEESGS